MSVLLYGSVAVMFTVFFFFNDTATTEIYSLSLHDALPISTVRRSAPVLAAMVPSVTAIFAASTLYSFIEPTPPAVLEAALVNVLVVVEAKLVATAALFVIVGVVTGLVEMVAPL